MNIPIDRKNMLSYNNGEGGENMKRKTKILLSCIGVLLIFFIAFVVLKWYIASFFVLMIALIGAEILWEVREFKRELKK